MDEWDLLTAVDVTAKLPGNFYEQLELKKWDERKKPLDDLAEMMAKNPKLDPKANYGELVDTLHRLIAKDSNIQVVASAARCLTGVANGLRTKYTFLQTVIPFQNIEPYLANCFTFLVDANRS